MTQNSETPVPTRLDAQVREERFGTEASQQQKVSRLAAATGAPVEKRPTQQALPGR